MRFGWKFAVRRSPTLTRLTAAIVIAALLISTVTPTVLRSWTGKKGPDDFAPVYSAARAMASHLDIYAATAGLYIYSPFLAFIFQPLTALPEHVAAIAWLVMSAFIIFAASLSAAREVTKRWRPPGRELDPSIPWLISATALLLSFDKLHADFSLGQTDCLMILGLVCVLWWMDRRPWLAGMAVGATVNIKYLTLIFVPYFLIKRNYRAAIASIVSLILFFILPAAEVGLRLMKIYAINAIAALVKLMGVRDLINLRPSGPSKLMINSATWDRSVSLTSWILRLTRSHGVSDFFAATLIAFLFAAVVVLIVLIARRSGVDLFKPVTANAGATRDKVATIEWAALVVLALVFSPQTTARHMILLILVYTVGMGILLAQKRTGARILLIVSMLVMAVALSPPFREAGFYTLLMTWRSIGGASWCALFLILSIAWIGSRTISEKAENLRSSSGKQMFDRPDQEKRAREDSNHQPSDP